MTRPKGSLNARDTKIYDTKSILHKVDVMLMKPKGGPRRARQLIGHLVASEFEKKYPTASQGVFVRYRTFLDEMIERNKIAIDLDS